MTQTNICKISFYLSLALWSSLSYASKSSIDDCLATLTVTNKTTKILHIDTTGDYNNIKEYQVFNVGPNKTESTTWKSDTGMFTSSGFWVHLKVLDYSTTGYPELLRLSADGTVVAHQGGYPDQYVICKADNFWIKSGALCDGSQYKCDLTFSSQENSYISYYLTITPKGTASTHDKK